MSIVYVVLPASIVLAVIAVLLFVWAARRGQFDDLETPGMRMLHDDEPVRRRASRLEPEREGEDEAADEDESETAGDETGKGGARDGPDPRREGRRS